MMRELRGLLAIWLTLCSAVSSADNSTNSTSNATSQEPLCGETFDQANAVREPPDLQALRARANATMQDWLLLIQPRRIDTITRATS